ncbi:hypothetical protein F5B22DRAFT_651333 [Xylaria bambusicola]|uniref:uncharacterized protein n=1 Tax=Xylaria bambusicola TaxID=326684 RepID=UPI002007ACE6|nr:uncharacterized protein F5B22DRAFT_651333 [Xylaria bambusicola]KAI0505784.1 hypothetical protein F5B22DRAFT_651333 [Xylaria bambusicola]
MALSLGHIGLALFAVVRPASAANRLGTRLVGRVDLVVIFFEIHRVVVIRGNEIHLSTWLGPAFARCATALPALVHSVPSPVPMAVASAALQQRCLDFTAPWV